MMLFINPRGMMKLRSRKYRETLADLAATVEQSGRPTVMACASAKQQRKRQISFTFVQTGERAG